MKIYVELNTSYAAAVTMQTNLSYKIRKPYNLLINTHIVTSRPLLFSFLFIFTSLGFHFMYLINGNKRILYFVG